MHAVQDIIDRTESESVQESLKIQFQKIFFAKDQPLSKRLVDMRILFSGLVEGQDRFNSIIWKAKLAIQNFHYRKDPKQQVIKEVKFYVELLQACRDRLVQGDLTPDRRQKIISTQNEVKTLLKAKLLENSLYYLKPYWDYSKVEGTIFLEGLVYADGTPIFSDLQWQALFSSQDSSEQSLDLQLIKYFSQEMADTTLRQKIIKDYASELLVLLEAEPSQFSSVAAFITHQDELFKEASRNEALHHDPISQRVLYRISQEAKKYYIHHNSTTAKARRAGNRSATYLSSRWSAFTGRASTSGIFAALRSREEIVSSAYYSEEDSPVPSAPPLEEDDEDIVKKPTAPANEEDDEEIVKDKPSPTAPPEGKVMSAEFDVSSKADAPLALAAGSARTALRAPMMHDNDAQIAEPPIAVPSPISTAGISAEVLNQAVEEGEFPVDQITGEPLLDPILLPTNGAFLNRSTLQKMYDKSQQKDRQGRPLCDYSCPFTRQAILSPNDLPRDERMAGIIESKLEVLRQQSTSSEAGVRASQNWASQWHSHSHSSSEARETATVTKGFT